MSKTPKLTDEQLAQLLSAGISLSNVNTNNKSKPTRKVRRIKKKNFSQPQPPAPAPQAVSEPPQRKTRRRIKKNVKPASNVPPSPSPSKPAPKPRVRFGGVKNMRVKALITAGAVLQNTVDDGHCFFRTIAHHVFGSENEYQKVRDALATMYEQLATNLSDPDIETLFLLEGNLLANDLQENANRYDRPAVLMPTDTPAQMRTVLRAYAQRVRDVAEPFWGGDIDAFYVSRIYNRPLYVFVGNQKEANPQVFMNGPAQNPMVIVWTGGNHYQILVPPPGGWGVMLDA